MTVLRTVRKCRADLLLKLVQARRRLEISSSGRTRWSQRITIMIVMGGRAPNVSESSKLRGCFSTSAVATAGYLTFLPYYRLLSLLLLLLLLLITASFLSLVLPLSCPTDHHYSADCPYLPIYTTPTPRLLSLLFYTFSPTFLSSSSPTASIVNA